MTNERNLKQKKYRDRLEVLLLLALKIFAKIHHNHRKVEKIEYPTKPVWFFVFLVMIRHQKELILEE